MPRLLPEVGPDEQLNMLDSLMAISGAQIHHLIMVRQCLKDGLPLAAYSTPELAKLISRSERTVRVAKSWFNKHIEVLRKISAAWLVEVPSIGESSSIGENLPPSHAEEFCRCEQRPNQIDQPDDYRQAVDKLNAIGWGKLLGCFQVRDPKLFTQRFGANNVLYAIWCAEGHQARNPAGFVTYKLQQGLEAPKGWSYPVKDEYSASVAAFMQACASQPAPAPLPISNQLVLQFAGNPGDCSRIRLHHYGFHYDSATRQWTAPETPATREVWEDEIECGTTGFQLSC